MGRELRQRIAESADLLLSALAIKNSRIFWGSSGSALFALLAEYPGFRHGNIVTTAAEHPALIAALRRTGAELRLAACPGGKIDSEKLSALLDANTVLIAIHHVHNETGVMQDVMAVRQAMRESASRALLLVDTIQSAGKIPLPCENAQVDIAVVSGSKIGVPGGGALLLRQRPEVNLLWEYLESCRTKLYIAGRPNPALAISLAEGCRYCGETMQEVSTKIVHINHYLRKNLASIKLANGKRITFTISPGNASPYILHFTVPGYQSAVLIRMLSHSQIYAATGSACRAETSSPSNALIAMGFNRNDAYAAIRLSFWRQNTIEEAEKFIAAFTDAINNY